MALVNPNIAMSFRQPEFQPRNALAEYAQVQQIMGGQRQAEMADMQIEELRRKERAISQIQAAAVKHGGPTNRREIAQAYIKSGVPEFMKIGLTMDQDLDELEAFDRIMGGDTGGAARAAPSAAATAASGATAPGATPTFPIAGKDVRMGTLGTGTFDSARSGDIGLVQPGLSRMSAADRAEMAASAGPGGIQSMRMSQGPYMGTESMIADILRAPPEEQAAIERALPSMKIPGVSAGRVPPFSQLSRDLLSPETRNALSYGYAPTSLTAPAESVNALAPPPENVNQLAAAGAAPAGAAPAGTAQTDPVAALLAKRDAFLRRGTPRALQAAKSLDADIARVSKTTAVTPGSTVIGPDGRVIYTAPAAPTAPKIDVIGVAKGTETPVFFDARTDEQFTLVTDAAGKQTRKPYTGGVNRSTSTVTATATSSPAGKSLAAEVGQRASTSLVKAEGAAGIMENANMVREALNTGNVIAGPLAGVRTKFAQVLELAGAGDKEKLVATRSAIQGLASLTLESRAELKGQGQITDTETKLLERARSAEIGELTIAELQQVVNVAQRLANRMWSSHQNLLGTMETDPAAADTIRYYRPSMSLPQAIGEGRPQAETDKRTQGLDKIFKPQPR